MDFVYKKMNPSYVPNMDVMVKVLLYDFSGKVLQYLVDHGAWCHINMFANLLTAKDSLISICAAYGNWRSLEVLFKEAKRRGIVVNLYLYDKCNAHLYHPLLNVILWQRNASKVSLVEGQYYGNEEDFVKVFEILVKDGGVDLEHLPVKGEEPTLTALQKLCSPMEFRLCKPMIVKCIELGGNVNANPELILAWLWQQGLIVAPLHCMQSTFTVTLRSLIIFLELKKNAELLKMVQNGVMTIKTIWLGFVQE